MILSCSDAIATALSRYLKKDNANGLNGDIYVSTRDAGLVKLTAATDDKDLPNLEMIGECPDCGDDVCDDTWEPVCGCDAATYINECWDDQAGVSVLHLGVCG